MKAWQLHLILRELKKQGRPEPRERTQEEIDSDWFVRQHRRNQELKQERRARREARREARRAARQDT